MQVHTRFIASICLAVALFTDSVYAGSITGLVITGGDNQSAPVGTAFPQPLSVRLTDSSGYAIENETIEFTVAAVAGAGAELASFSVQTDANGDAETMATAGNVPGSYIVQAAVRSGEKGVVSPQGSVSAVDFRLSNLGGSPAAATALPASSNAAMLLLVVLLGFLAWRARETLRQRS